MKPALTKIPSAPLLAAVMMFALERHSPRLGL
jgi:hypothetical protein